MDTLSENIVTVINTFWKNVFIFVYIFASIIKEIFVSINDTIPHAEKVLIVICIYNFITIMDTELINEKKFEKTNTQINYLKISEEMWTKEIITRQNKYNSTIVDFENKLSACNQSLDILQKMVDTHTINEKIHIKKCSVLTQKINKLKKELKQYD